MPIHPTEYCAAPYQTVVKVPEGLPFTEAAGISWSFLAMIWPIFEIHILVSFAVEVFLTAYQAITWNGHLKDGETILIHAVSMGVFGLDPLFLPAYLHTGSQWGGASNYPALQGVIQEYHHHCDCRQVLYMPCAI